MAGLCPKVGEAECLTRIFTFEDSKLKLFSNNLTPADTNTTADFTEATAANYSAKTLSSASWTFTSSGNISYATYTAQTFTFTGTASVYGYYITNSGGTVILFAERWSDNEHTWPGGGGTQTLTPKITLE